MAYKIHLDFTANPNIADKVEISGDLGLYYKINFVSTRVISNQCTIGTTLAQTIINLNNAFQLDHNSGGQFVVSYDGTSFEFSSETYFNSGDPTETLNNTSGRVVSTITEIDNAFAIDNIELDGGDCDTVSVAVYTNQDMQSIMTPIASYLIDPPKDYFTISLDRYLNSRVVSFTCYDGVGGVDSETILIPSLLLPAMFTITQSSNPLATNVSIANTTEGLTLEYSINGTDYQSEPLFTNLLDGEYTLYVKDQFDCEIEIEFSVVAQSTTTPYFHISKSNALRYAKDETVNETTIFANDENSLSCQTLQSIKYKQFQQFKVGDIIKTQFKSSYATNTAKLIDSVDDETTLIVEKISNYLDLKEKRDAKIVTLDSGKYGVYFVSGNIYDYNTESVTGTYDLLGELPEWAEVGNWIVIDSIFYQIENNSFNETVNAWQIEFTSSATLSGDIMIGSVYNLENYEIYEFSIDTTDIIGDYTVQINGTDTIFGSITFNSEILQISTAIERSLFIEYWNDVNTDFFITDWTHKMRIGYISITPEIDNESETFKSDETATIYDVQNYEVNRFVFTPQTTELNRKLVLALSHKNVKINGILYTKKSFELEGLSDFVNIQKLTAVMTKSDSGNTIGLSDDGIGDMPILLADSESFISAE